MSLDASLLVIGAGPAGLMAAWTAAQRHPSRGVLVVDRMPVAGAKLAVTGGGRGNLSHLATEEEFAAAFGRHGRFALPAFRALPPEKLQALFSIARVPTTVDSEGRIYPRSQSAPQVRDALYHACVRAGVQFAFNQDVHCLCPPENPGALWRVDDLSAWSVLLAAGGQSVPRLGSDGSGFALAQALGYRLTPPVPALTSLQTVEHWPAAHSGLALPDVTLSITGLRSQEARERGEILFTHHGISGPAVLNLSGRIARLLLERKSVPLQMAVLPEEPNFLQLRQNAGRQRILSRLSRILPRAFAGTILDLAGIPIDQTFSRLAGAQEERLLRHLAALPLNIHGTGGFKESMATSGGISLKQIRPESLEGRLTPRLHFAGEILDLDGPTGGWNLNWAFCSGHLAGLSAAL